jgi:D-beta-D-heptose 7-phosphate kinase/D-beta-D-heptose 1-phosphate adenosyltransferase
MRTGYSQSMTDAIDDVLRLLRTHAPQVTVIGEAMLDRWVRGGVQRVSREAPVPVVEVGEPDEAPGGAANTAANLAALGAEVRLVALVGDDDDGRRLVQLLDAAGVDTTGIVACAGAVTPSKTRIVGGDQILVRVDRGVHPALSAEDRRHFERALSRPADRGVVLICDYGMGLLDAAARAVLARLPRPRALIVDAHDPRVWAQLAPDVVTPNAAEAELLIGLRLPTAGRADAVAEAARTLLAAAGASSAVVTLDRDGTVVLDGNDMRRTYATPAPENQASGAGDTFAAALAAAIGVGVDLGRAAEFAQRAADVVVAQPGTSVCTLDDLASEQGRGGPAALSAEALRAALEAERARGRRIVFTNGCFDVLHLGHTMHLRQAKALGDVLVVAVNDDASVQRLKGPGRPVNPIEERTAVIESLGCVDYVVVFAEDSPVRLLQQLRPEIYAKGGDYTPEMLEETGVVRAYGGEVRILDFIPAHSTSAVIDRIATRALLR